MEISVMNTYRVYFRSDIQWAMRHFQADTPEQAIDFARRFADDQFDQLDFESYNGYDCPINEIEVCDDEGNELIIWHDQTLRMELAASDLLRALENLEARIARAYSDVDLTEARAAIAKARGSP
jgi:hypothetical protein